MISILETLSNSKLFKLPWPIIFKDGKIAGDKYSLVKKCSECEVLSCLYSSSGIARCEFGVNYRSSNLYGHRVIFPECFKAGKSKSKASVPDYSSVSHWVQSIEGVFSGIDEVAQSAQSDFMHAFHDPLKWANQVGDAAENIIQDKPGADIKEKLDNTDNEIKTLYNCSKLFYESVSAAEISLNPAVAGFGRSIKTNVFKLFDKVQSILYYGEAKKINKRFKMLGQSYKEVYVYQSFSTIALCLLQNALKYSKVNEIEVFVDDIEGGVEVRVISIGPIISSEDQRKIFEKGYRGESSKVLSRDGQGVGLFVAQEIADRHGFSIDVNSYDKGYEIDGLRMAQNTFFFKVPDGGVKVS